MYDRGAVARSVDPVKLGAEAKRYWLVLSDDSHPSATEQSIAVAITTALHEPGLAIPEDARTDGGLPRPSYVSPWALHSPRVEDVTERLGRMGSSFCETVLAAARAYLE